MPSVPLSTEGRKNIQTEEPLSSLPPPSALLMTPAGSFYFAGAKQNDLPRTPMTSQSTCALSFAQE